MCARAPSQINYHFRCVPRKTRSTHETMAGATNFWAVKTEKCCGLFDINVWCTWGRVDCRGRAMPPSIDGAAYKYRCVGMLGCAKLNLRPSRPTMFNVLSFLMRTQTQFFFIRSPCCLQTAWIDTNAYSVHRKSCARGLCTQNNIFFANNLTN